MTISIIAAVSRNRVIGKDGDLPWRLPADLRFFKRTTSGHPLVMGRKTYESLDEPLPNRTNIVITRQKDYGSAEGVIVVGSLEEGIERAKEIDSEIFIGGGEEIFRQALSIADRMLLTWIDEEFEGDTYFPEFDAKEWRVVAREAHEPDEKNRWPYAFVTYERR